MTFQLGLHNFQSWFKKDIKLVKMNSLLKFDDCWEECLGKLDIYRGGSELVNHCDRLE